MSRPEPSAAAGLNAFGYPIAFARIMQAVKPTDATDRRLVGAVAHPIIRLCLLRNFHTALLNAELYELMEMFLRAVLGETDHSQVLTEWAQGDPETLKQVEGLLAREGAKLQAVCQQAMPLSLELGDCIERKFADEQELYMAAFRGVVQHSPTSAAAVRRVRAALEQEAEEVLPGRSALLAAVRSKVPAALRRVGNLELHYPLMT